MSVQTPKYRHVIFDFDGVICDSLELAMQAFNEIQESRFPQVPRISSRNDMTKVYAGSLRSCLYPWLSSQEAREFFDIHSARMAAAAPTLKTFPGIGRVLSQVGPRRVSIVTSAYSNAVTSILRNDVEFDDRCLNTVAGRELHTSKTEKIALVLSQLGLKVNDAVYVGDLESDILYCKAVPMDVIAVGYGYHPHEYLAEKGATYLVETVSELSELLGRLIQPVTSEVPA